ncbi:MAG: hypothetical protein ACTHMU_05790 [Thermomicrobiales bacterium]
MAAQEAPQRPGLPRAHIPGGASRLDHFSNPTLAVDVAAALALASASQSALATQLAFVDRYYHDLEGFFDDCIRWLPDDPSDQLAPYQRDFARELVRSRRFAAYGPHGLGKSMFMSGTCWWFGLTSEIAARLNALGALGELALDPQRPWRVVSDWKILTTAGSWKQLKNFLWPEIRKWAKRLNWERIGRSEVDLGRELLQLEIHLEHGQATSVAASDAQLLEGAHAPRLLFLYDEAKSIPARNFDATEGAFSTAGPSTGREAYACAFSTPGDREGRFYEITTDHLKADGERRYEHWAVRAVTLEETIQAGRNDRDWSKIMARQWGVSSPVYVNRVLGQYADFTADGVIPYRWVEAAMERWQEDGRLIQVAAQDRADGGVAYHEEVATPQRLVRAAVDPADSGADDSVLALLFDNDWVAPLQYLRTDRAEDGSPLAPEEDAGTAGIAQQTHVATAASGCPLTVDAIGVGAGVASDLRVHHHRRVHAFKGSGAAPALYDPTGTFEFVNRRAQMYWLLRLRLRPDHPEPLALPPDDRLLGDLTAPRYKDQSGRILVESKDELRKAERLGRSPDAGDAVAMLFAQTLGYAAALSGAKVIEIPRPQGAERQAHRRRYDLAY